MVVFCIVPWLQIAPPAAVAACGLAATPRTKISVKDEPRTTSCRASTAPMAPPYPPPLAVNRMPLPTKVTEVKVATVGLPSRWTAPPARR
jgi:hypothetical protein